METSRQPEPAPSVGALAAPLKIIHAGLDRAQTYHVDGGWAVINNQGNVKLSLFTENPPVPPIVVQSMNPDGSASGAPKYEGIEPNVVARDIQCNIILPLTGARQLHQLLGSCIQAIQQQMGEQVKTVMGPEIDEALKKRLKERRGHNE
jgi:hypothetical protein